MPVFDFEPIILDEKEPTMSELRDRSLMIKEAHKLELYKLFNDETIDENEFDQKIEALEKLTQKYSNLFNKQKSDKYFINRRQWSISNRIYTTINQNRNGHFIQKLK